MADVHDYALTKAEHDSLVARTGAPATHTPARRAQFTGTKDGRMKHHELRSALGMNKPPDDEPVEDDGS